MNPELRRKQAEMQHALLHDRESDQPFKGMSKRKVGVPGGNVTLPVYKVVLSPNGSDFWSEDMVAYILSILDETVTNGYAIFGDHMDLLSDESELGDLRASYALKGLLRQGATNLTDHGSQQACCNGGDATTVSEPEPDLDKILSKPH